MGKGYICKSADKGNNKIQKSAVEIIIIFLTMYLTEMLHVPLTAVEALITCGLIGTHQSFS